MRRFRTFIHTSLLGGIVVILPVAIMFLVFRWIFHVVKGLIGPFVRVLGPLFELETKTQTALAHFVVLAIIVATCFLVGVAVRTRLGGMAYRSLEQRLVRVAPGYSIVKETISQLLGSKHMPFSEVALLHLGNGMMLTVFIAETHSDGSHSVFVPTPPNPATGQVLHVPAERVEVVKIPMEKALRSIIGFGLGSDAILSAWHDQRAEKAAAADQGGQRA